MRIVTRGDMDGLTGSVIVSRNQQVDDIELIHPQDITAGRAEICKDDVLINVPYHPECGLWFDHHAHTATYPKPPREFDGLYRIAPSAAGLGAGHNSATIGVVINNRLNIKILHSRLAHRFVAVRVFGAWARARAPGD